MTREVNNFFLTVLVQLDSNSMMASKEVAHYWEILFSVNLSLSIGLQVLVAHLVIA
jgi:hypothetical protein